MNKIPQRQQLSNGTPASPFGGLWASPGRRQLGRLAAAGAVATVVSNGPLMINFTGRLSEVFFAGRAPLGNPLDLERTKFAQIFGD